MALIHFLNVLEGDCNIIQHDSGNLTVWDVSNAYNTTDTEEEKRVREYKDKFVKNVHFVPTGKIDYKQKGFPDNPIAYIRDHLGESRIFRFIISHPDMDHLDGIRDLYNEFSPINTWCLPNEKELDLNNFPPKFNSEDWKFYTQIRNGIYQSTLKHAFKAGDELSFFKEDNIKILSPNSTLINNVRNGGNIHDLSYVVLFTVPHQSGKVWKFIFAGDSHDNSWEQIIQSYKDEVKNVDVLFAPHHGRDSDRSYKFLETLNPRVTLFGNASSVHLAYDCYKPIRITNNQAGYVIMKAEADKLQFFVKNKEFAVNFCNNINLGTPVEDKELKAWGIFQYTNPH